MVPLDVPEAALDMMRRFIEKKSFFDAPQPVLKYRMPVAALAGDKKIGKHNKNNDILSSISAASSNWDSVFFGLILVCVVVFLFFQFLGLQVKRVNSLSVDYHPYSSI